MGVRVCHVTVARHVTLLAEWWPDIVALPVGGADEAPAPGPSDSDESLVACCAHGECRGWAAAALRHYAALPARNDCAYKFAPDATGEEKYEPPGTYSVGDEHVMCAQPLPNGIVVVAIVRVGKDAKMLSDLSTGQTAVPDCESLLAGILSAIRNCGASLSSVPPVSVPHALSDCVPAISAAVAQWSPVLRTGPAPPALEARPPSLITSSTHTDAPEDLRRRRMVVYGAVGASVLFGMAIFARYASR